MNEATPIRFEDYLFDDKKTYVLRGKDVMRHFAWYAKDKSNMNIDMTSLGCTPQTYLINNKIVL